MFRILVVDDDKNTRWLTQTILETEGYQVLCAKDGEEALALLRRARIASERKIQIGDVTLDYDSMTVSRKAGVPLEGSLTQTLPQKEFLLLYKLLSYPGRIFTRIELMDEIWGQESSTGWETVTVHIGRLRKRFEGWPEFEIVSVRGLGYKAVKKV
ncbi:MAG: response regulator transcription factor [Clostridiales bacterium]|nr:response regulator transcription factor [Clostridiales bacterium]